MKLLTPTLVTTLVFALAAPLIAQDKQLNDVTVSPHNYKHPNKAAMRPVKGIEFREAPQRANTIVNYKEQQRRGGQLATTIAIPARDVAPAKTENYKQQNLLVNKSGSRKRKVKEPVIEPVTQEAIGN